MKWIAKTLLFVCLTTSLPAEEWGTFSWHLDYLFWRACPEGFFTVLEQKQDALSFSTAQNAAILPEGEMIFRTKANYVEPNFTSGIRLGFSYPLCDYNLLLLWTYFSPNYGKTFTTHEPTLIPFQTLGWQRILLSETAQISSPTSGGVINQFQATQFLGSHIKTTWSLDLNLFDIALTPAENPKDCWKFEPDLLFRFFSIKQKLFLKTEGTVEGVSYVTFGESEQSGLVETLCSAIVDERINGNFSGGGPRIGLKLIRTLCTGFAFEARGGATFALGDRKSKNRASLVRFENVIPEGNGDDFIFANEGHNMCLRPFFDLFLGFSWETHCLRPWTRFLVRAGWEHHYFFNVALASSDPLFLPHFDHRDDSLTTQGFTLALRWEF